MPVRIRVYAGELSSRGITVFVADPKSANVTEAAGPQNGWNRTSYVLDRGRAHDVIVLDSPAAANAWKALALRSEREGLAVIFIDWQVAR